MMTNGDCFTIATTSKVDATTKHKHIHGENAPANDDYILFDDGDDDGNIFLC